jgi:hypothetical protein
VPFLWGPRTPLAVVSEVAQAGSFLKGKEPSVPGSPLNDRQVRTYMDHRRTHSYLRWRGIEATLQLAQSANSKVVIVGSGKDGLPIILGNVDADAPPAGAAPTSTTERAKPPSRAMPLKQMPAAGLSTSTEKTPAAASDEQRFIWPTLSLSDIEASLARVARWKEPKTEPLSRQLSERPAAEQPR